MKKYILMLLASVSLASCVDTVLLPDSMTVDEDYWKTKDEVNNMINGAFKSMIATDVIERFIVWGDFRSDELVQASGPTGTIPDDLEEIEGGAIETDNTFSTWGSFYSVINNCNIVLSKAEGVMKLDPNYTEADYKADRSQMLALRALCYFSLVKAYRDVPYITEPYMNSSQEMNVVKVAPETVLNGCIADLKEAEANALNPDAFSDWRKVGYINKNGIDAMLADIYLWLASVKSKSDAAASAQYYQDCVDYCDKIITYLDENVHLDMRETAEEGDIYHLYDYNEYFDKVYCDNNGSSRENILELICSTTNSNTGLCQMYNRYASSATTGYAVAPSIYGSTAAASYATYTIANYDNAVYGAYDMRLFNNVYSAASSSLESFYPRKFVALTGLSTLTSDNHVSSAMRAYANYDQNWIVYRLPDIMLMKAEALVQLTGNNNDDYRAREAFELVRRVNMRSLYKSNKNDSLTWNVCKGLDMEKLVLQERSRELSFEGKRWYDLLRYNYRHMSGTTDYTLTLNEMQDKNMTFATNYDDMMTLMTRKFTDGSDATVKTRLATEPYLYMPVNQSEIEVNPNLKQNPVYSSSDKWNKNI